MGSRDVSGTWWVGEEERREAQLGEGPGGKESGETDGKTGTHRSSETGQNSTQSTCSLSGPQLGGEATKIKQ